MKKSKIVIMLLTIILCFIQTIGTKEASASTSSYIERLVNDKCGNNIYQRFCAYNICYYDLIYIDEAVEQADSNDELYTDVNEINDGDRESYEKLKYQNGNENAYRHSFWHAKMVQNIPYDLAIAVGNAHETTGNYDVATNSEMYYDCTTKKQKCLFWGDKIGKTFNDKEEAMHYMDLYNNMKGRQIGNLVLNYMMYSLDGGINKNGYMYTSSSIYDNRKHYLPLLNTIKKDENGNIVGEVDKDTLKRTNYYYTSSGNAKYNELIRKRLKNAIKNGELVKIQTNANNTYTIVKTDSSLD